MRSLKTFFSKPRTWILLLLAAGGVLAVTVLDVEQQFRTLFRESIEPWIQTHPVSGPLAFVGVYVLATLLFVPGSLLGLFAGALFGPVKGTVIVSVASTIGAGLAFLAGRYLFQNWIEQIAGDRLNRMQEGIRRNGGKFVAFTRLIPLFPFNILNFAFGLTRINFWRYVWISWLCMLPGTTMYVYFGWAGKELATGEQKSIERIALLVFAGVALILLYWILRRWFRSETDIEESPEGTE